MTMFASAGGGGGSSETFTATVTRNSTSDDKDGTPNTVTDGTNTVQASYDSNGYLTSISFI